MWRGEDPLLARSVAVEKNYSVRATKQSNDELGLLVDGFNEMLGEIQERDFALEAARGNDDEMKRLAEGLDAPDALSRIDPEETGDGFRAHLYYWDTSRPGRPVLERALADSLGGGSGNCTPS